MFFVFKSDDVENGVISTRNHLQNVYRLHSFTFTNDIYNVTNNNNILPYQEGASYYALELTNQYGNGNDIATDIASKINAVTAGTATVVYSAVTGKFTISNTTNFYLKFGDVTTNTCEKLLGFSQTNTSDNTSATSDKIADLVSFKHIYIKIDEDKIQAVRNHNYKENSFIIQANSSFGDKCCYMSKNNDIEPQLIRFSNPIKRLTINFYDELNSSITINNWVLTFCKSIF